MDTMTQTEIKKYKTMLEAKQGAHARELPNLPCARLGVESLGVAQLADLQRHVQIDLDKLARRQAAANRFAVLAVRGDEGGNADHPRVGKELGHLADAPDVLATVLRREAQVVAQAVAHVVAVEHIGQLAALEQLALQ